MREYIEAVLSAAAECCGVSQEALVARKAPRTVRLGRNAALYVLRKRFGLTVRELAALGQLTGAAAANAVNQVEQALADAQHPSHAIVQILVQRCTEALDRSMTATT